MAMGTVVGVMVIATVARGMDKGRGNNRFILMMCDIRKN